MIIPNNYKMRLKQYVQNIKLHQFVFWKKWSKYFCLVTYNK